MSAEQVKRQHFETLGPELGPVYHALWNECAWLHMKWQQHEELYGSNPERIDLMNRAAGLFFRVVQDTLWDDTLLHLTALTDPVKSAGKENLTVRRVIELVDDDALRAELVRAVEVACTSTEFARDWRNRRIAHRDLALAIAEGAKPLSPASRKSVRDALNAISEVLKLISRHYFDSDLVFLDIPDPAGAESLLYVIRDGVEADQARRDRLSRAEPNPEDLLPPRSL